MNKQSQDTNKDCRDCDLFFGEVLQEDKQREETFKDHQTRIRISKKIFREGRGREFTESRITNRHENDKKKETRKEKEMTKHLSEESGQHSQKIQKHTNEL